MKPTTRAAEEAQRLANHRAAIPGRTVVLRIRRCDGPGKPSRWEDFRVPIPKNANVISCLQWIAANQVTATGSQITSIVWDSGCLEEVCGACTMVINGKVRQSCSCLIDDVAPRDGDVLILEPMSKFPVVRDLWVDRARLFHALRRVKAWVPIDGTYSLGAGPREEQKAQEARYRLSECMSCACCLEACPQYVLDQEERRWGSGFIGAHAISQARLFNEHETGKSPEGRSARGPHGPGRRRRLRQRPELREGVPQAHPAQRVDRSYGRATTLHAIKRWFQG